MFNVRRPKARIEKIPVIVSTHGGKEYRGGQIRDITGGTATIRLFRAPNLIIDRTCSTALLGAGAQVGNPVCVEVSDPSGACTIVALHDTRPMDHALEAAWTRDRSTFSPGCIPVSKGGNP
jgi:hypothetical protein